MRLKLFHKMLLLLLALAILPAAFVGWRTSRLNEDFLKTNILELEIYLARNLSDNIDDYLKRLKSQLEQTSLQLRLSGFITENSLRVALEANSDLEVLAYLNSTGKVLVAAQKDFAAAALPREIADFPNRLKYRFGFESGAAYLETLYPLDSAHENRGKLYAKVSLDNLWKKNLAQDLIVQSAGRQAFIVDSNGKIIARSQEENKSLNSLERHPIVQEALQKHSLGAREFIAEDRAAWVGAYAWVEETRWVVIVQQPKNAAFYAIAVIRKQAVKIVFAFVLLAGILAFWFAKQITRPILAMRQGAREIAQGHFDVAISVKTRDEIEELAQTFNEMAKELKGFNALQINRIIDEKNKTDAVVYSIADGIMLTDMQGNVLLVNRMAEHLLTRPSTELSDPHMNIQRPELLQNTGSVRLWDLHLEHSLRETLSAIYANPLIPEVKELVFTIAGKKQYLQIFSRHIQGNRSSEEGQMLIVIHDISLERELDQMKESFFHAISHDLRNPLTSIMGFLKFFGDEGDDKFTPQQKSMLNTMQRAAARMLGMINDIMDAAKIEAGQLQAKFSIVDISLIVKETLLMYQPLAEKKKIVLVAQIPELPETEFFCEADQNQMERVISNLIANAIKFTPSDGKVSVVVGISEGEVQVSVIDNGPGIPLELRERVFEKFQQVGSQRLGGTGLGLTICRYFVNLHRGKIWIETGADDVGTAFKFWIPRRQTAG